MDLGDVNLQPLRLLGQGSYGRVFLCRSRQNDSETQRDVCVKRIIVQNPKIEMKMIQEEVYIISQLKHPNIVQFIRSFQHAGTVNIVMEYMSNGTMRDFIHRTQQTIGIIKPENLLRFFCDMLMGLEYLHIRHVIHRDIKPENLLLDAQHRIKYADFGISAIHNPCKQYLNSTGTPYYMAPEVLNGGKFDFKSDIWSLGCVLVEMCLLRSPFEQATNTNDLRYLMRVLTRRKFNCSAIVSRYGSMWGRMCEQMLAYESQKRATLSDLLCCDRALTLPFYQQYFNYQY